MTLFTKLWWTVYAGPLQQLTFLSSLPMNCRCRKWIIDHRSNELNSLTGILSQFVALLQCSFSTRRWQQRANLWLYGAHIPLLQVLNRLNPILVYNGRVAQFVFFHSECRPRRTKQKICKTFINIRCLGDKNSIQSRSLCHQQHTCCFSAMRGTDRRQCFAFIEGHHKCDKTRFSIGVDKI